MSFRLSISLAAIILPIIFLIKGIYGSFLFSFSVPLLWQVGLLGKPFSSLGLRRRLLGPAITVGLISGCLLGLLGGNSLRFFGITGFHLTDLHQLQFAFGSFNISFPLQKEASARILAIGDTFINTFLYLVFCIFVIGLGEELFWRGFIQKKIARHFSKDLSIWLTALLFASLHFYVFIIVPVKAGILFLTFIAIAGAFWGYLFAYFDNIWSVAFSHGIVAFIIWKYYFFAL